MYATVLSELYKIFTKFDYFWDKYLKGDKLYKVHFFPLPNSHIMHLNAHVQK